MVPQVCPFYSTGFLNAHGRRLLCSPPCSATFHFTRQGRNNPRDTLDKELRNKSSILMRNTVENCCAFSTILRLFNGICAGDQLHHSTLLEWKLHLPGQVPGTHVGWGGALTPSPYLTTQQPPLVVPKGPA